MKVGRLAISLGTVGVIAWVGVGCPQKTKPPPAPVAAVAAEPAPTGFEVEMRGTLQEQLHAPRYIALLTTEPCDVGKLATTYVKALGHPDPTTPARDFYVEPVVQAGERLFLCGAALDGTGMRVLGFGSYPKNPIVFQAPKPGEDDAELEDLDFALHALKKPVALPFNRF